MKFSRKSGSSVSSRKAMILEVNMILKHFSTMDSNLQEKNQKLPGRSSLCYARNMTYEFELVKSLVRR